VHYSPPFLFGLLGVLSVTHIPGFATQITVLRRRRFGVPPETRFPALVPPTD
jgi:hypothetical protein